MAWVGVFAYYCYLLVDILGLNLVMFKAESSSPRGQHGLPKPESSHPIVDVRWKHQLNCFLTVAMSPLTITSLQPTWL